MVLASLCSKRIAAGSPHLLNVGTCRNHWFLPVAIVWPLSGHWVAIEWPSCGHRCGSEHDNIDVISRMFWNSLVSYPFRTMQKSGVKLPFLKTVVGNNFASKTLIGTEAFRDGRYWLWGTTGGPPWPPSSMLVGILFSACKIISSGTTEIQYPKKSASTLNSGVKGDS